MTSTLRSSFITSALFYIISSFSLNLGLLGGKGAGCAGLPVAAAVPEQILFADLAAAADPFEPARLVCRAWFGDPCQLFGLPLLHLLVVHRRLRSQGIANTWLMSTLIKFSSPTSTSSLHVAYHNKAEATGF